MSRVFSRQKAWWIDYVFEGKRVRKRIGHSKKLAEDALRVIESDIVQQRYTPERYSNGRAFSEMADQYWTVKGNKMNRSYFYMLREIRNRFGDRPVGAITPADVQRFYDDVTKRASVSTANRNLVFFGSIFNWAIRFQNYHGKNPCRPILKRKEPNHRTRYLTLEEMKELLRVCHPRLYPVVVCALSTGMRRQEVRGMQWENVDMERGIIHILKSKTGRPRHIRMISRLRSVLAALGSEKKGSVFNLPDIMLRRYFEKAIAAAGIVQFRFHDLRHTFASWYAMRTNDIGALREILGHQNIQMTMRYAHLCTGHHAANLSAFESVIPNERAVLPVANGTNLALTQKLELEWSKEREVKYDESPKPNEPGAQFL